jgi:hypothetical protein
LDQTHQTPSEWILFGVLVQLGYGTILGVLVVLELFFNFRHVRFQSFDILGGFGLLQRQWNQQGTDSWKGLDCKDRVMEERKSQARALFHIKYSHT